MSKWPTGRAYRPAAAAQSYLLIEKIIDACRRAGAEAVHPLRILSERAAFATALATPISSSSVPTARHRGDGRQD